MPERFIPELAPQVAANGTLFRVVCTRPQLWLQLYRAASDRKPSRTIELDPSAHRNGHLWEITVPEAGEGQLYTWATHPERPLIDPNALLLSGPLRFGHDAGDRRRPPLARANDGARFKSIVVTPPPPPTWQRPRHDRRDLVIYELHVRGFTRHQSAGVDAPGTFRGLAAKAGYLRELGVNAVELLPVSEFDETEVRRGVDLFNFWGYSPVNWFAPNRRYAAAAADPLGPLLEFREMVQALHAAGIEVILDVVFNHTAEMDAAGPHWSYRDLAPEAYYLFEAHTGDPVNLTGCGNTVRAQHPAVRSLIRGALRWWVHELGVDGFRFDLATILARGDDGRILDDPPLLREIEGDPALADARLIAEPWDAAGGYRLANWPGNDRWAAWNDRYRDDVRRAWLGHPEFAPALATRLSGSSDLIGPGPGNGVNFVTAHDGFTLRDMVSFSRRHNLANGEEGRDGHRDEPCANHGVEGATDDIGIRARRERARRNLIASLLLSQGIPMLLAGDEFGRSQRGNNNAYCHDNELTWVDWTGLEDDAAFHRFVRGMIALRRSQAALRRDAFLAEDDVVWFGPDGGAVDWADDQGAFGYRLGGLVVLANLHDTRCGFRLPDGAWTLVADTAAAAPRDLPGPDETVWAAALYHIAPRALAILQAR